MKTSIYVHDILNKYDKKYITSRLNSTHGGEHWMQDAILAIQEIGDHLTQDLIILDTETTGVHGSAEIIELGMTRHNPGCQVETFHAYITPTHKVPQGAIDVHKITNEMLDIHGQEWCEVWPRALEFIGSRTVAIYNSEFDTRLIEQMNFVHDTDHPPVFETWDPSRPLAAVCGIWQKTYNCYRTPKLEGGHTAVKDCLATYDAMTKAANLAPLFQV